MTRESKQAPPREALRCDLQALDDSQRKRRDLLHEWLQVGTCEIVEHPNGYEFWLDPRCHISQSVDEFIALEGSCCPFVKFGVQGNPDHEGPVLVMSGDEAVKSFLAAQLGIRSGV